MKLKYTPCGALCEICKDFRRKRCKGCVETKGKPWFLKRFTKFPCKKFLDWYNPRIGFFRSSLARVGSLFLRKKVGTKKWKEILVAHEIAGNEKDIG